MASSQDRFDLMPIIETAKGAAAVRDIAQADSRV